MLSKKSSSFAKILGTVIVFHVPQSFAWNNGNLYVDNDSNSFLYAQFIWGSDHQGCSDDLDDSIHKVKPHDTLSNSYIGSKTCDFKVNIFKKGSPKANIDPSKPAKPYAYQLIATEKGTWERKNGEKKLTLDSHDTPPRFCAGGYQCTTDRTSDGNHLHLEINDKNNTYSHVKFINNWPKDNLYVNYDRIKGDCSDSVDNSYFKVPPMASFSDAIRNSDKNSSCTYNINISTTNNSKGKICQIEVKVGDDSKDRTYISSYKIKSGYNCDVNQDIISKDGITYDAVINSH